MTTNKIAKQNWIIASWNINSVRLRKELVASFLKKIQPDFLALQEIKCDFDQFPKDFFAELGYQHQLLAAQKAYHGVAILSRHPFIKKASHQFGERKKDKPSARHIYGSFKTSSGTIGLHNFYVPAGGDEPDVKTNPKFAHKLRFIKSMEKFFNAEKNIKTILVGDLNIAPYENDVWSHKQLLNVVSHTPIEIQHLNKLLSTNCFVDIARNFVSQNKKLYSWWSYRAADWKLSNRGRRLDHIWTSPDLVKNIKKYRVEKNYRGRTKPSDHVPIIIEINL